MLRMKRRRDFTVRSQRLLNEGNQNIGRASRRVAGASRRAIEGESAGHHIASFRPCRALAVAPGQRNFRATGLAGAEGGRGARCKNGNGLICAKYGIENVWY